MPFAATRRVVCSLMIGLGLGWFAQLTRAEADPLVALNAAGEQRMLSQRIVKSFAQLGLNLQPLAAKAQLDDALHRFDANLESLREPAQASPQAGEAFLALEDASHGMRALAVGVPSLLAAERLTRQADSVLVAAERLVRALGASAATPQGSMVSLAGRQRMLSQRLAKAYLLATWGTRSPALREELDAASLEFAGGLALLREQPQNSAELRRELDDLRLQWDWLQTALDSEGASSYQLVVVEAADAILAGSERVTRLYQELAAR